jgi:cyclic pyranopterin phosphate synthase
MFRIIGGEPRVRRNILWLYEHLGELPNIRNQALTTNGTQLAGYARALTCAGVTRINIRVDSLKPERFRGQARHRRSHVHQAAQPRR